MMHVHVKNRGVLALATVGATVALSGLAAGSAEAALPGHCLGTNVAGQGASLQKSAQAIWNPQFNLNASGCNGASKPTSLYTSTSSGAGLNAWNANGNTSFNTANHYIGTDDAPSATQIANINKSVATGGSGSSVLSIPVTQAAIALPARPPAGCTISSITRVNLERLFRSTPTTWASIGGTGASCSATVTKVVRADASGTTYQFKHYLFTVNSAAVLGSDTWATLQVVNAVTPPALTKNQTWPGTVVRAKLNGTGAAGTGTGGGDLVKTVANTSGSIGYADLATTRANYNAVPGVGTKWLSVVGTSGVAVNPSSNGVSATKANANCTTASAAYGTLPSATTSWSGVYLKTPGSGYAICALTWDLALADYRPKFTTTTGPGKAQTVKDYLNYVLSTTGGQSAVTNNDYKALPSDVRTASASGVSQIVD